ncbi:hypothetical protein [Calothrix sp. PCC 6303]|uniref:hypothetical protein n=1 Tax=Calothrix sp. PCC 6303 TaxID=1170562 RepID=UPI0002A05172|nr:hypothetical protein [Calothrix sp. PCC 6303]AFZ03110.1 hypothetical protein Cal6303_4199 [Calothrix sp. PCC 6303]
MQILLIANTIFEIGIGCVFLFFPNMILKDSAMSISLLRVIGCGALAFGTLSFLMLDLIGTKALKPGLITLCVFHTATTISQIYSLNNNTANPPAMVVHSLFAISFCIASWQLK